MIDHTNNTTLYTSNPLVLIDSGVEDWQTLAWGVKPEFDLTILDSQQDGIEQITRILANIPGINTIHIMSHGSPGCLYLGNTQLSLATLALYAPQLSQWFSSYSIDPSLLLYGCNVASGDAGEEFIQKLHHLTGASIAASSTPIGSEALGGNWQLDRNYGAPSPLLPISEATQASYTAIL